jgi:hypothetical protein
MSREKTQEDVRFEQWLHGSHPLPRLADHSLEGRRLFLEQHEDTLWAFWSRAFSIAISDGTVEPRRALGAEASEPESSAREIADRLISALRTRPVMDSVPAWGNLERWYAWLIGRAAAWNRRHSPEQAGAPGDSEEARGELFDLGRMLERWQHVLKSLVERTGVPAIELDWLWATRQVRKQLPEALGETPEVSRLVAADLRTAIAASSSPGASRGDRTARTREGAAACIRFNIEELATRIAASEPALTTAREIFVGPADCKPPYRPQAPVGEAAVDGFLKAWELSEERARPAPEDGRVERLWKDIFRCGLKTAALRLLPRKLEEALRVELSQRGATNISKGSDEP